MEILGVWEAEEQPASLMVIPSGSINLVQVKRTYYLYRRVMVPQTSSDFNPVSFNPGGGTTVFNSGQR
jgi:hypothetical protein